MATRERICPICGVQFSYEVSRGKDRLYCGKRCAAVQQKINQAQAAKDWPICSADGCTCRVRSSKAAYCEAHYMRVRRRGALSLLRDVSQPNPITVHSHGYLLEWAPNHPLTKMAKGRVYQHRRVFYDAHGDGPFACNWCGQEVTWATMHVDHINAQRDDNRQDNLVASCPACNKARGWAAIKATARRKSSASITWNGVTRSLSEWAEIVGITGVALAWRIKAGWPMDRAMTQPRGVTGPR